MAPQQPINDDLEPIEKDNEWNDLPASQDDVVGAHRVHSKEETQSLTRKFLVWASGP